jgi:hypothetical protein
MTTKPRVPSQKDAGLRGGELLSGAVADIGTVPQKVIGRLIYPD